MKKINIQPWYDKTNRYSSISRNLQIILLLLQLILLLMYIIVSFKAMPYSDFTFSMFVLVGGICIISSILILYVVDHIDNIFINIFDLQTFDQYLSQQLSVDKVSINGYGQNSAFHNFPPSEGCYDISCRYGDERKDYNMTINLVTKTIKLQEKEKISLSKSIQYDSTGYLLLQKKLSFIDERIKAGDKRHELSDTQWGIYRDEIRTLLQRDLTEKQ